jgi:diketogulonate reductase-like aldo/keto reductase
MNLPLIGFGTSPYRAGKTVIDIEHPARIALAAGYRMFDFAEIYGNERAVGRALRSANAPPRQDLVIIGKVWRTNYRPEHLRRACEDSLRRIGIDAFDLYLLHAPEAWRHVAPLDDGEEIGREEFERRATPHDERGNPMRDDVSLLETWEAMRALRSAGLASRIGVSNFSPGLIATLGEHRPDANEIPCWPFDAPLLEWHSSADIDVIGYSPLRRDALEAPLIETIASAYARTSVQIVLRWLIQSGIHPLTSSANPSHIRESLGALDFELSTAEMQQLTAHFARQP